MKYCETEIVFREFPNEVTLAINISGCPHRCKGCHSPHLQTDCGEELNEDSLMKLIEPKKNLITCIGIMGGDADIYALCDLVIWLKTNYPKLKIGWYSGYESLKPFWKERETMAWLDNCLDYVKLGPYVEELGPLDCKTTNQRFYKKTGNGTWEEIKFYENERKDK